MFNEFGNVAIIFFPKGDYVFLAHILVIAVLIPQFLVIKYFGFVIELSAHKSMMIIRSTVDEVADDLLFTPLARSGYFRKLFFAKCSELCRNGVEDKDELSKTGLNGVC